MKFKLLLEGKNLHTTIDKYIERVKKVLPIYFKTENENPPVKYTDEDAKEEILFLLKLDPTYVDGGSTTGDYGEWVLNFFLNNAGHFNDVEVADTLGAFNNAKKYIDNKDINSYKSLYALQQAVKTAAPSPRQLERQRRSSNHYTKVWENEDWVIFEPKDYKGALTLGKGTHWCTADSRTGKFYV